jgi:ubiquinone/menaquinone biosynthesis C-methylase UbiE
VHCKDTDKGDIQIPEDVRIQRQYYSATASSYDDMHLDSDEEHRLALCFLEGVLDYFEIRSILDVGAGTGRVARYLKSKRPNIQIVSVEPVEALREQGHRLGLAESELIDGDAYNLPFEAEEFDLVCEFAMLHHVRYPYLVVDEMLRVSRKAVFISDCNNFGQGSWVNRTLKQTINALGLWRAFNFVRTGGKGYQISEGDGLFYSYSVFNDLKRIKHLCKQIHLLSTKDGNVNLYRTAAQVALLGIK